MVWSQIAEENVGWDEIFLSKIWSLNQGLPRVLMFSVNEIVLTEEHCQKSRRSNPRWNPWRWNRTKWLPLKSDMNSHNAFSNLNCHSSNSNTTDTPKFWVLFNCYQHYTLFKTVHWIEIFQKSLPNRALKQIFIERLFYLTVYWSVIKLISILSKIKHLQNL